MGIIGSRLSFLKRKKNNAVTNGSDPIPTGTNAAQAAPLAGWKKGEFDGVTYNYLSIKPGAEDKPVFLLLHGFPNGPSNYKDFIPLLTDNGYGVILPELLGYGETEKPTAVEAYAFGPMCRQLVGILDAEGVDKVIGLGHDFGAPLIARFSQFYPDRVTGIILGGASYNPPSPQPLNVDAVLAAIAPILGYENIGYFKFFAADHAPKALEDHLDSFLSIMFGPPHDWKDHVCKTGGLEGCLKEDRISEVQPWLPEKDLQELRAYLKKGGLLGPCMWFRAAVSPVNVGDHGKVDPRVKHPYLYISPSDDPSTPLPLASRQDAHCDDITTKTIKTGHWIFEQDPKGAAQLVLDWGKQKGLL